MSPPDDMSLDASQAPPCVTPPVEAAGPEPTSPSEKVSPLASQLGRTVLHLGNYPGRGIVGTFLRKRGRRKGGHSFTCFSEDGLRLACWFSPAAQDTPGRLPVVMSHGWVEFKECHFRRAWQLNQLGHDVVLFDHRSHGRSKGRYVTFGVRERHDLGTVLNHAIEQQYICDHVITMGFSLGAATVLQHAAIDPRVAGVVAFAPFVDFGEAVRSFRDCLAPWMNEQWLMRGMAQATRNAGFELDEASTLAAMREIEVPVLLVEAGRDVNLPPASHTRKLAPAKTKGRLEMLTVDEAGHQTLCRRTWPGMDQTVAEFLASISVNGPHGPQRNT